MSLPPLLIRADASTRIGTGHVMRCLALAQAYTAQGGQVFLASAELPDGLALRLRREAIEVMRLPVAPGSVEDGAFTARSAASVGAQWIVLDGYGFTAAYQRQLKEAGYRVMAIDDHAHLSHYYADIVLNQNLHAVQCEYTVEPYTRVLCGTKYALLRREFWPWQAWRRHISPIATRVLITLGGSDPHNVSLTVLQALQLVDIQLDIVVVLGPANPHQEAIWRALRASRHLVTVKKSVTQMPRLMAWADLAVAAGGSTCWELAFMGLPSLVCVTADNQLLVAESVQRAGFGVNLGWARGVRPDTWARELESLAKSRTRRARMHETGRYLVDGMGAFRAVGALLSVAGLRTSDGILRDDCR